MDQMRTSVVDALICVRENQKEFCNIGKNLVNIYQLKNNTRQTIANLYFNLNIQIE